MAIVFLSFILRSIQEFDYNKPTKFIVHGFSDSYKGVRVVKLKDGFLKSVN